MDEFVATVPSYILFSLSAFSICLALCLPRIRLNQRRSYEYAVLVVVLLTVVLMAATWSSRLAAVLVTLLVFTLRWRWQLRRPWFLAGLLSTAALATAFLPQWPDLGVPVVLQAGNIPILSVRLRPTLFAIAINLIALSPNLSRRSGNSIRPIQSPVTWSIGLILVAFVLGWWFGGIHFTSEKWRSIMGLPVSSVLPLLVGITGHALLVAAIEESFFRGVLIPALMRMIPTMPTQGGSLPLLVPLGVSSLLFGLAHLYLGWSWVLGASLAGVGYGILYTSYRSVLPPILLHAFVVLILTAFFSI